MIIGPLEFARPEWLLLLPVVIAAVWWIGRKSLGGLGDGARRLAFAIRILVVAALVITLAGPEHRLESDAVATITVVDRSDSLGRDAQQTIDTYLLEASASARQGEDRIGVVTAARDPLAQLLPIGGAPPAEQLASLFGGANANPGRTDGTDLASSLRLALALKPDDAAARILLLTDGNETEGVLLDAARSAKAAGVPVDVVPVVAPDRDDVVFESLTAPRTGRIGQTVRLAASIRSSATTRGTLSVFADGTPIDISPSDPNTNGRAVELQPGANRFSFTSVLPAGGPLTYRAVFTPDNNTADAVARNNEQRSTVFVESEGRVLLYAMESTAPAALVAALRDREIDVEVARPGAGPANLTELQAYDAVIFFDIPQSAITLREQQEIASYVHDLGGGFVMIGGPDSFGAGGWIGTPIAEILPVRLDPPAKRRMPRGALAIVLDNSGSMAAPVTGTSLSQLEVAVEGAAAAVGSLSELDIVTVIRFDSNYEVVVPPTDLTQRGAVFNALRRITSGGGTNMLPGLRRAIELLREQNAAVKHAVVLSDGQTMGNPGAMQNIVNLATNDGITISTITIGDFSNDQLMERLATLTGGTYYPITTSQGVAQLPEIFITEAQLVRRSLIWEGDPVQPTLTGLGSSTMGGINALPPVTGYVVTADRGGAALITSRIQTDPDTPDPFTAQWQHGLGRVAAFTSDATARWSTAWLEWPAFAAFWEQHARWVMRPAGEANVRVATRRDGDRTLVTLTALDDAGEPVNFGTVRGRVAFSEAGERDSEALTFRQTGPGRYEGSFTSDGTGTYLMAIRYDGVGPEQSGGTITAAVDMPFADEFRTRGVDRALLERVAAETGGRVLAGNPQADDLFSREGLTAPVALTPIWIAVALAAVGLFLADVAVRRVRLSITAITASVRSFFSKASTASGQSVGSLRTARDRARSKAPAPARAEPAHANPGFTVTARDQGPTGAGIPAARGERPAEVVIESRSRKDHPDTKAQADAEESGMSRLLAAKRRARHTEDDDDNRR